MSSFKKSLKTPFLLIIFFTTVFFTNKLLAQDVTTIQAANQDVSDNLDLEAVASIFGESKDLEDFEKRLNDPNTQISNLDLNNDGEVDYLRVMESSTQKNLHTISIQAIIGKDQYQEVATIDVEKDSKGDTQVQVVGNVDMYGPNYYIAPVYPVVPVFFTFFWVAAYRPWYSPWYWGYHPPYFRPWPPYPAYRYRANVHVHINVRNSYNRTNVRMNKNNVDINNKNNSYFKNNPDKSFNKRNPGVSNRDQLANDRKGTSENKGINTDKGYGSTGKPVTKPNAGPSTRPSHKPNSKPSSKPSTKPSTRPSTKPNTKPSTKPSYSKPSTRPSTKPSTRQSYSRPSSQPSTSRRPASRSSHMRTRH